MAAAAAAYKRLEEFERRRPAAEKPLASFSTNWISWLSSRPEEPRILRGCRPCRGGLRDPQLRARKESDVADGVEYVGRFSTHRLGLNSSNGFVGHHMHYWDRLNLCHLVRPESHTDTHTHTIAMAFIPS